jgi:DNA-binding transcriptional MerR regulator
MDELVERVREALAAEYSGAGDGRIRDVPDRRAIRWYTTIGLVDRPLGMRGRTALYGPRHLQQLVAIKRRQAAGRSLSQIQGELNWVSDEALAELSRVPERLLQTDGPEPEGAADHPHMRFWARPAAPPAPAARGPAEPTHGAAPTRAAELHRAELHGAELHGAELHRTELHRTELHRTELHRTELHGAEMHGPAPVHAVAPVHGVVLPGGVVLLVPRPLTDRDRDDIAAAAAPLLDLLDARGLLDGSST